jgi:hypothetical protein
MSGGEAIPFIALVDGKFLITEEAKQFLSTVVPFAFDSMK